MGRGGEKPGKENSRTVLVEKGGLRPERLRTAVLEIIIIVQKVKKSEPYL